MYQQFNQINEHNKKQIAEEITDSIQLQVINHWHINAPRDCIKTDLLES